MLLTLHYKNRVVTIEGNMYENKRYMCLDGLSSPKHLFTGSCRIIYITAVLKYCLVIH